MENKFTAAYSYFAELAKSNDFLSFILDNITCGIMILNKNMELQAFNDPFKNMFVNKKDEHLLYVRCGEAIGCANQVSEEKRCGETSKCLSCSLRIDALESYTLKKPIFRHSLTREFFKLDGSKENKTLHYTLKPFYHKNDYYLMALIESTLNGAPKNINTTSLPSESFYS